MEKIYFLEEEIRDTITNYYIPFPVKINGITIQTTFNEIFQSLIYDYKNVVLKDGQNFFGKDEKIYVYECKKCHKLNPVPGFVIGEHLGFLKFIKAKKSFEMECPYCGGPYFPIKTSEDS